MSSDRKLESPKAQPAFLLDRMDEEMRLRGFAKWTRRRYRGHARLFLAERGPDMETSEQARLWFLSLLEVGLSHNYVSQAMSALKFLFRNVLDEIAPMARIPRPKRKQQLPRVLSPEEVRRLLEALGTAKHRAMGFTLYASGLRVGGRRLRRAPRPHRRR